MIDKYIGKPVLKHCYCEHGYKKSVSEKIHQKGSKSKKRCVQGGIEPRMVNSLQLRELDVQNIVYPWFGQFYNSTFH